MLVVADETAITPVLTRVFQCLTLLLDLPGTLPISVGAKLNPNL